VWIARVSRNLVAATLATVLLSVSAAFWIFSTDAYYITPAAAAVAATLCVISVRRVTATTVILAGIFVAIAILFWQANVFLIPVVAIRLWRDSRLYAVNFIVITVMFAGGTYMLAALMDTADLGFGGLASWFFSHSSENVPIWGVWSAERVGIAFRSQVASLVVPSPTGGWDRKIEIVAVGSLALLSLITWVLNLFRQPRTGISWRWLAWLLFGYAVYAPFIIWWDPFETKWFIIPNMFLIGAAAHAWSYSRSNLVLPLLVSICIILVGFANASNRIWPDHVNANRNITLARCVVEHVKSDDALIATDWNWLGYSSYFFGFNGRSILLIGGEPGTDAKIRLAKKEANDAAARGANAYMRDLGSYDEGDLAALKILTGLSKSDQASIATEEAFKCGDARFLRVLPQ
jgi:hypothetical protein